MTWTEVPAPNGRRCWVAWYAGDAVMLERDVGWFPPWVATDIDRREAGQGTTPCEALEAIVCDLPAPQWRARCGDTEARTPEVDAEETEPDDRPVMAWWGPVDGGCYRWGLSTDPHGTVRTMRSQDPHPARYAAAMGWRAVEVPCD